MRLKVFALVVLLLISFVSVYSQSDWETVPIDKWEKRHVEEILNDSAWVQKFSLKYNFRNIIDGETKATVLLRSSLLIRLAMLRERQLKKKYDKMNSADKSSFDKKNSDLLACSFCDQFYAISVISEDMSLSAKFIREKQKFVYLENDKGVKRELANFLPATGGNKYEQIYFFARKDEEGNDFLDNSNKSFSFNLDFSAGDDVRDYPVKKVIFTIADISLENQIIF